MDFYSCNRCEKAVYLRRVFNSLSLNHKNSGMNFKKMLMQVAICMVAVASMASRLTPDTAAEFAAPPMQWRPVPLWFWEQYICERTDCRGAARADDNRRQLWRLCAILPFGGGFQPGYLSDDYFALYEKAIEVAKATWRFDVTLR